MPLTKTGNKVLHSMIKDHGNKAGTSEFYATINSNKAGSDKWEGKGAYLGKQKKKGK